MPARYFLLIGTFLLSMLLYVDRVCISTAKKSVAADLSLTDREMAWVFGAFSLGYALFQTPAGILADRFGPRLILTVVVCCWSLFTALTAAARTLGSMLLMRFLFGAGEAGAFPGISRAIFSWQPMSERGLAHGINFSASRLGAAFAMPGVAWLIQQFGWRLSFVILGAVGFVWAIVWYSWFRNDPADHPSITQEELDYILKNRQAVDPSEAKPRLRLGSILLSTNMWLVMGQYFASNFTFFFCLTWLLPHVTERFSLNDSDAGWYAMMPFLAGMVGNWVGGGVVDGIYRRGSWQLSRRAPAIVGFLLAALGLLASLTAENAAGMMLWLSLAVFGADMTLSPSWSVCTDIGRRNAGAVSGTMNMAGNLGSFVTSLAFPYLREWTGSSQTFFVVGALLNLTAVAAWSFIRADRPLENQE